MKTFDRLIVCGDSFQSVFYSNDEYNGTHWSQLVAKQLGVELLSFSCPGASDIFIAYQLLESLKYDLTRTMIVVGPSHGTRLNYTYNYENNFEFNRYDISLKDFKYLVHPDDSVHHPNNAPNPGIYSFSVSNPRLDKDAEASMMKYVPFAIADQVQHAFLINTIRKVFKRTQNILVIKHIRPLVGSFSLDNYESLSDAIPSLHLFETSSWYDFISTFDKNETRYDPGYHTEPHTQVEIAQQIIEKISQL